MAHTVERFVLESFAHTPVSLIRCSLDPGGHTEAHTHSVLEFSTILSGCGEYRVEQQVYPIQAGDILVFNNTERHSMWNTGTEPLVNLSFEFEPRFVWQNLPYMFDHSLLDMFFRRNDRFSNKLDRENPAFNSIAYQFSSVQSLFEEKPLHADTLVYIRLVNILADILQYYDITNPSPQRRVPSPVGMDHVLRHIHEHYDEPISMTTLASIMHVNKNYFGLLFRKCNGLSPQEYIIRVRIAAAAQQLRQSDTDILEIAESCGFNSSSNFYAAFKRITGCSPAQYRQNPLD